MSDVDEINSPGKGLYVTETIALPTVITAFLISVNLSIAKYNAKH
jgi:hypothetical protein